MSLQARAEAINGRLTTFDTRAALYRQRADRALTEGRRKKSARSFDKYQGDIDAAGHDYFAWAAEFRRDLEVFARDAAAAGHDVYALVQLLDRDDHASIQAARVALRLIAITPPSRDSEPQAWPENTTRHWAEYFAVTTRAFTDWAQRRDWIVQERQGRYRVNLSHPEPIARRLEVEKKRK